LVISKAQLNKNVLTDKF